MPMAPRRCGGCVSEGATLDPVMLRVRTALTCNPPGAAANPMETNQRPEVAFGNVVSLKVMANRWKRKTKEGAAKRRGAAGPGQDDEDEFETDSD